MPYTEAIRRGIINDKIIDEIVEGITDFDDTKVDMAKAKQVIDKYFPVSN